MNEWLYSFPKSTTPKDVQQLTPDIDIQHVRDESNTKAL